MIGLANFVAEHGEALDFDLFDRWRVRLRDVPRTIGWDAVALFARHLPRDGETMREIVPAASWSVGEHLMARMVDQMAALIWGLSGGEGDGPEPLRRPGDAEPDFDEATHEDMDAILSLFSKGDG